MTRLKMLAAMCVTLGAAALCDGVIYSGPFGNRLWAEDTLTSSTEAQNAFAIAARLQNREQFDLAAEDWERFVAQFPHDPLVARARYYAGICRLQLQNYEPAVDHFQLYLDRHPDAAQAEDALLNLGWCQYSLAREKASHDYGAAVKSFQTLIKRFPRGKHRAQALFYLGESEYGRQRLDDAITHYRQLVDEHRDSPHYTEALYALGVAHEEIGRHPSAKQIYQRFLRECRSSELLTEVRMRRAETELQTGNAAEAEREFAAVAAVPGFPQADHALWRQAACVSDQQRYRDAGRLYAELVERFPESQYRPQAVLAAARGFYLGRQFRESRRWLEQALAAGGSDSVEAAHWLCRLMLDEKNASSALKLAERILKETPSSSAYRVQLELDRADAIYATQPREAVNAYYEIARSHPNHELAPQALYNTAFVALEIGKHSEAKRLAGLFREHFPDDELMPDVRHVAAEAALQLREYADATRAYERLIAEFQEHEQRDRWRIRLAFALHLQQLPQKAASTLGEVIGYLEDPALLGEAHFVLGVSNFELQQYDTARQHLTRSYRAHPDGVHAAEALLYLSRSQQQLGDTEAAINHIKQIVQRFPNSPLLDQAYYRLGEYQLSAGRFPQAKAAYRHVIDSWPQSTLQPHANYGLGWAELKAANYRSAIDTFTRLLAADIPQRVSANALFARGIALRQSNRFKSARRDLDAFLATGPSGKQKADALFERGLAEAGEKDFRAAAGSLERAVAEFDNHPQIADIWYELAWAHEELGDAELAVATFRKMLAASPEHPFASEAYYHIAERAYAKQQYADAIASFTKAHAKANQTELAEQALHKLAWTYYRMERHSQAAETFERQLANHPEGSLVADARFMMAECLYKAGDYAKARQAYSAAAKQLPSSPAMQALIFLHGGQAAAQLERWDESIRLLNEIPKRFADSSHVPQALFERGRAHQALGQRDAAMADYRRAATLSPDEVGARAQFMMGEAEFAQRDFEGAIKSYRRVIFGFGGRTATAKTKGWQAMAAYEAARCAEVLLQNAKSPAERTKHKKAAVSFYERLINEHNDHELAPQAQQRLIRLNRTPDS